MRLITIGFFRISDYVSILRPQNVKIGTHGWNRIVFYWDLG